MLVSKAQCNKLCNIDSTKSPKIVCKSLKIIYKSPKIVYKNPKIHRKILKIDGCKATDKSV